MAKGSEEEAKVMRNDKMEEERLSSLNQRGFLSFLYLFLERVDVWMSWPARLVSDESKERSKVKFSTTEDSAQTILFFFIFISL